MGRVTAHEKRVATARALAQKKAAGGKLEGKVSPALGMAYAYEEAFGEYVHRPGLKFIKNGRLDPENVTSSFFAQAARLADSVKADYDEFVRAQFYWIHKWFGRPCRPHELRGKGGKFPAVNRWREYRKLGNMASVSSSVTYTATVSEEELDKINKGRLEHLMELWGLDEDQCLIAFVPEGIFDEQWLLGNSSYQRLRRINKL